MPLTPCSRGIQRATEDLVTVRRIRARLRCAMFGLVRGIARGEIVAWLAKCASDRRTQSAPGTPKDAPRCRLKPDSEHCPG